MMKTTRIILITGLMLCAAQYLQAQVKIGKVRDLEVGEARLLEMQAKLGELLIVTDSLELGITTLDNANTTNPGDAMMLKLFGYGLGNFDNEEQTYFLGTNTNGQVLEFPLRLDLDVIQTGADTSALLSLYSIDTFGTIDLMPLDTIFATDQNLIDSVTRLENTLTTLIGQNKANDLDTIQINEFIHEIRVDTNDSPLNPLPGGDGQQTLVLFYEDQQAAMEGRPEDRNLTTLDLHPYFPTHQDLADTAADLRGSIFYLIDGTITSDRTVDGASGTRDLTFTEMDSFTISSNNNTLTTTGNTSVTSTGTTTIGSDGNVDVTSNAGDVSVSTTSGDVNITSGMDIVLDAAGDTIEAIGVVNLNEYPSQGLVTDTSVIRNMLGIDQNGNIINVSANTILGTQEDSVIYRHNGTLISQRYMTMDAYNLHFIESDPGDTVIITNDGRVAIGTGTFTPNSAGPNPSNVRLEVNGDILASRVYSSSDERYKKNITPIRSALDKVLSIDGVTYDFRIDEFKNKDFPTSTQLGFIAQNVEKYLPEVVNTDGNGYKSVDYAKVTALLNEAIKEQQRQITSQDKLIQSQQTMISAMLEKYEQISGEMADLKSSIKELSNQTLSED